MPMGSSARTMGMAAMRKATGTAGPQRAAAMPVRAKMPAPMMAPTSIDTVSRRPRDLFSPPPDAVSLFSINLSSH